MPQKNNTLPRGISQFWLVCHTPPLIPFCNLPCLPISYHICSTHLPAPSIKLLFSPFHFLLSYFLDSISSPLHIRIKITYEREHTAIVFLILVYPTEKGPSKELRIFSRVNLSVSYVLLAFPFLSLLIALQIWDFSGFCLISHSCTENWNQFNKLGDEDSDMSLSFSIHVNYC